ncbi:hypothetical protein L1987_01446 [Smallanthus sonchifolius]|uniref:Uncharacterized protein n=1 Tax=Smallanthus sonchifolius TaxID=185202 RepID=A0ACB9K536_9ASTR|nr:hypothetical protein L1987_01446 [Smallanthus sonchifolius]
MAAFGSSLLVLMAIMVASMQLYDTVAETTHVVGDALGWTILPGGAAALGFTTNLHEVVAANYEPCTSTNPIYLATTIPDSLTLTTAGTHYYICTFPSHCQIGQKLTINVSTSATTPTTPASPPTTTPPSTTPTTPASPPTTTPTPPSATPTEPCPPTSSPTPSPLSPPTFTSDNMTPPSNGASSFTAVVPATFLAIG